MSASFGPVVSPSWLAAHLDEPDLRVLDATWYLPHLGRDARAEYLAGHVPGAVYFDIDAVKDARNPLPHMLPPTAVFAEAVGRMGIGDGDRVVAYGQRGMIASARVWWTFRVFGHDRVAVLDGGMPAWAAEHRAVQPGEVTRPAARFTARFRPELVRDLDGMRANLERRTEQVVDARSRGRFTAAEPEVRPGLRGGHIPGSRSLPYDQLFGPDGALRPPGELRQAFEGAGLDLTRPIVATCGSGVSAAVLALGLHVIGRSDVAVYDGSWTEWGGRADTPVET
jgi:thiosulfate/3-mercaptopyruvate sulfurtransferase